MIFLYGLWMNLPIQTRIKLAEAFGIKKTSSTHVADNFVQSDGYRVQDVEAALTVDKMQDYTESNEFDHYKLWELTLKKVNGSL